MTNELESMVVGGMWVSFMIGAIAIALYVCAYFSVSALPYEMTQPSLWEFIAPVVAGSLTLFGVGFTIREQRVSLKNEGERRDERARLDRRLSKQPLLLYDFRIEGPGFQKGADPFPASVSVKISLIGSNAAHSIRLEVLDSEGAHARLLNSCRSLVDGQAFTSSFSLDKTSSILSISFLDSLSNQCQQMIEFGQIRGHIFGGPRTPFVPSYPVLHVVNPAADGARAVLRNRREKERRGEAEDLLRSQSKKLFGHYVENVDDVISEATRLIDEKEGEAFLFFQRRYVTYLPSGGGFDGISDAWLNALGDRVYLVLSYGAEFSNDGHFSKKELRWEYIVVHNPRTSSYRVIGKGLTRNEIDDSAKDRFFSHIAFALQKPIPPSPLLWCGLLCSLAWWTIRKSMLKKIAVYSE